MIFRNVARSPSGMEHDDIDRVEAEEYRRGLIRPTPHIEAGREDFDTGELRKIVVGELALGAAASWLAGYLGGTVIQQAIDRNLSLSTVPTVALTAASAFYGIYLGLRGLSDFGLWRASRAEDQAAIVPVQANGHGPVNGLGQPATH